MDEQENFILVETRKMEKPNAYCKQYLHKSSGAPIFCVETDDKENTFLILFHTPPKNAKGIPHVLEHMVLSGSQKYPIKDPFFALFKRNFPTCVNAFTGDDYTGYFGSSIIQKDFYRIFEVYLDAIFSPLLKKETFLREAIRLERKEDTWKAHGIVFNEMQGDNAKPESAIWESLKAQFFPETHYMFNSGGIPLNILDLSYEEILEYHEEYYKPELASFFFYGNTSTNEHLSFLDTHVFKRFSKNFTKRTPLIKPNSVNTISHATCSYPGEKDQSQSIFAMAWILGKTQDPSHALLGTFFEKLLLGHDGALLTKKVIKDGFCNYASGSVIKDIAYTIFLAEFYGVDSLSVQDCEKYIIDNIKCINSNPILEEDLLCTTQQISVEVLEIESSQYPYGLELILKGAIPSLWQANFFDCIEAKNSLDLLQLLSNEEIAKRNIQERLLGKNRTTSTLLLADPFLAKANQTAIQLLIEEKTSKLTTKNIIDIEKSIASLKKMHSAKENEECIPKTSLSELPKKATSFDWHEKNDDAFILKANTNGFIYVDLFFPIQDQLGIEALSELSAWTELVTKVQSTQSDSSKRIQNIETFTSAFEIQLISLSSQLTNKRSTDAQIFLHIHIGCMATYAEKAFSCLQETINFSSFDNRKHIKKLLKQIYTENSYNLSEDAYEYVQQLASAHYSASAYIDMCIHGIKYHETIERLQTVGINDHIISTGKGLIGSKPSEVRICCEEENVDLVMFLLDPFLKKSAQISSENYILKSPTKPITHIHWPTTVQHNAIAIPFTGIKEEIPYFQVWSAILSNDKLLPKIREEQGAYGACAKFFDEWNTLVLSSYRDPESEKTIEFFLQQIHQFDIEEISEQHLSNAKRAILRQEHRPIVPSNRGVYTWTHKILGLTEEVRNQQRICLLNMTLKDWKKKLPMILQQWQDIKLKSFATFSSKESFP